MIVLFRFFKAPSSFTDEAHLLPGNKQYGNRADDATGADVFSGTGSVDVPVQGTVSSLDGFETYGGACWALLRLSGCQGYSEDEVVLAYQGLRNQFRQHTCGWAPPLKGVREVVVYTTLPGSVWVDGWTDDEIQPPVRVVELPRPEGWKSPEQRQAEEDARWETTEEAAS